MLRIMNKECIAIYIYIIIIIVLQKMCSQFLNVICRLEVENFKMFLHDTTDIAM